MNAIVVVGIIGLILGLGYFLYPRILNYYFKRPKIVLELNENIGITRSSSHLGYSTLNDRSLPVNRPEAISIYELEWKFNLTVRNNSEVNGFNLRLMQHKNLMNLNFKSKINPNKALKAHEEIVIPLVFSKTIQCMHKDLNQHYTVRPSDFTDLMLLMEYSNEHGKKFYSRYYFNDDVSKLVFISKKELQFWS